MQLSVRDAHARYTLIQYTVLLLLTMDISEKKWVGFLLISWTVAKWNHWYLNNEPYVSPYGVNHRPLPTSWPWKIQKNKGLVPVSLYEPVSLYKKKIQGHVGIQALIFCFSLFFRARTLVRACGWTPLLFPFPGRAWSIIRTKKRILYYWKIFLIFFRTFSKRWWKNMIFLHIFGKKCLKKDLIFFARSHLHHRRGKCFIITDIYTGRFEYTLVFFSHCWVWNAISAFVHYFSLKKNDFSLKRNHFSL